MSYLFVVFSGFVLSLVSISNSIAAPAPAAPAPQLHVLQCRSTKPEPESTSVHKIYYTVLVNTSGKPDKQYDVKVTKEDVTRAKTEVSDIAEFQGVKLKNKPLKSGDTRSDRRDYLYFDETRSNPFSLEIKTFWSGPAPGAGTADLYLYLKNGGTKVVSSKVTCNRTREVGPPRP